MQVPDESVRGRMFRRDRRQVFRRQSDTENARPVRGGRQRQIQIPNDYFYASTWTVRLIRIISRERRIIYKKKKKPETSLLLCSAVDWFDDNNNNNTKRFSIRTESRRNEHRFLLRLRLPRRSSN